MDGIIKALLIYFGFVALVIVLIWRWDQRIARELRQRSDALRRQGRYLEAAAVLEHSRDASRRQVANMLEINTVLSASNAVGSHSESIRRDSASWAVIWGAMAAKARRDMANEPSLDERVQRRADAMEAEDRRLGRVPGSGPAGLASVSARPASSGRAPVAPVRPARPVVATAVVVQCPGCSQRLRVVANGRRYRCPSCASFLGRFTTGTP